MAELRKEVATEREGGGVVEEFYGNWGIVEVGEEERGEEVLEGEFNLHVVFWPIK